MPPEIDHYAVMGNPVSHSLSPRIHQHFARQTGQHLDYVPIEVPEDGFTDAVARFRGAGGRGLNITVPFKEVAFRMADNLSQRAQQAKAVNTLVLDGQNALYGDNTDGVGLLTDLIDNQNLELTGRRLLLLGAGGAARGVTGPLLDQNPVALVVANRTEDRAVSLALDFSHLGPICGKSFGALGSEAAFDVIINATAASLTGQSLALPAHLVGNHSFAYDMVYAAAPTLFMEWALSSGARHAVDGLGMLVEQAAESFLLWRGIRPQTHEVIRNLRDFLGGAYA